MMSRTGPSSGEVSRVSLIPFASRCTRLNPYAMRTVAHKIYGVASTINSANYVFFLALEKCISLQSPTAIDIFTQELLQLHRGQGMEIYWRDSGTCPTEAEYLEMVKNSNSFYVLHFVVNSPVYAFRNRRTPPSRREINADLCRSLQVSPSFFVF